MVKILAFLAIAFSFFMMVTAPYIPALLYSTVSILQPQYVWFWAFEGFSIFKISAGIAIVAWLLLMLRGGVDWRIYNNGIFFGIVILCLLYYVSDLLTPFPSYNSRIGSSLVIDIYTTIVIMFFIVLGLINHQRALKYLVYTIIAITFYYTYWANIAYLEADWSQFTQGRLRGPRDSPYKDGNIFSILFVVGLPFVLFAIYQVDKGWQKALLIMSIPLIWHAMILCASRGALLSAGISTLVAATMIRSKILNTVLVAGFVVFMIDQGGVMVERSVNTVEVAESGAEGPINPRIISWQVAVELTKKYPILGVGPQRFLEASRFHFPGKSPHVAHNTFLNFSANLGIVAGIIYLMFFWISWKMYRQNKRFLEDNPDALHTYVNKACICSLIGFFVGSMFLDLIIFEPFYFLLLIIVVNNFMLKRRAESIAQSTEKTSTDDAEPAFAPQTASRRTLNKKNPYRV